MSQATKEDLAKHTKDIKEPIDLKLAPIIKEQAEVQMILTGVSKLNGLVGHVKTLSTNLKIIYTLLAVVTGLMVKLFVKLL